MAKKVLVVDNNESNRELIRNLLSITDFEMIEARRPDQALSLAFHHIPSLILMEIGNSVQNFRDFLEALRKNPSTERTRVIPLIDTSDNSLSGRSIQLAGQAFNRAIPIKALAAKVLPYVNLVKAAN
jgi:two-component system cell cycle response regulator DivK